MNTLFASSRLSVIQKSLTDVSVSSTNGVTSRFFAFARFCFSNAMRFRTAALGSSLGNIAIATVNDSNMRAIKIQPKYQAPNHLGSSFEMTGVNSGAMYHLRHTEANA